MTTIPHEQTGTMWVLSGQVDEGEPVRDIFVNSFPFSVGRRSDLSFRIPSPAVSNFHAEINDRDGQLMLCDQRSTNGTFVNGERAHDEVQLCEGDLIQFADVVFRLKLSGKQDGSETLHGASCDRAMALIQFDRLMSERAVIPFFQPIVKSADRELVGYEVLGRSHFFGLKTPCVMFQAASQLNLESELSRLCRKVGMEASAELEEPTDIFLNTHPTEMKDMAILRLSLQELRDSCPDAKITLEIHEAAVTSSIVMRDFKAVLDDLQIRLAYDDFGAGQARLIELIEVPPHVLKFDLGLIRGIDHAPPQQQQMLASLVRMVHDLGIFSLAEGMETEGEAETCQQLGFDLSQGFYYGAPLPVHEL